MSAFVVHEEHISAMLDAALAYGAPHPGHQSPVTYFFPPVTTEPGAYERGEPWGPSAGAITQERRVRVTDENAEELRQMLLAENVRSVNHRYAEEEGPPAFAYRRSQHVLHPADVLGAVDCYEYQSCEHPGWANSEAFQFCAALREHAVVALIAQCCPGHGQAWEITNRALTAGCAR